MESLEQEKKVSLALEMLDDNDKALRKAAKLYFADLPPVTGIKDLLMERLGNVFSYVSVATLSILGGISEEDLLQAVKERLTDDVESVRSAAVISLRKASPDSITGDIVGVLKDRLADSSNDVRVRTAMTFINFPSLITADVSSALLDRVKFDQRTGAPVEDFDETRARVIDALSGYDHLKEEDLLLLMRNLRPQLRNKDSQEATYTLLMGMLSHPAYTTKVAAELEKIVKEGLAFKLLAYMTAASKEKVYNMKLKEPNGQILMHYHGGGGSILSWD
jgi:HEAT repeat protein